MKNLTTQPELIKTCRMAYRYLLDQCSPDVKRLNSKQQKKLGKRLAETFSQTNPHSNIHEIC